MGAGEYTHLNREQRKAVETVNGRLLVLAGAGSGKTLVLTTRTAHLINNLGISPQSVLGLTFTNKAAAEMRGRLASLIGKETAKEVTLCTFHSFCMKILREEIHRLGYTTKFSLYDEQDVQRLVNLIVRDILQHEGELPSLGATMSAINRAKCNGFLPEEIKDTGSVAHDEFSREVYSRLQQGLRAYNAVDFDNLLSLTVDLFERFPDVLSAYQDRYRYIMIDEYQDTNPIQFRLATLLSGKYGNLCVVGDDDQSIYGWRGADIKNILEFSNATVIKLEQNYRSTSTILHAANSVIACNKTRHSKRLWSDKGEGQPIEVFHAPNEIDEAQAVVNKIVKLKEAHGLRWKDIAVLYRSNALSRLIESALMKQAWKHGDKWVQGIPYEITGGTEFYERREVKDICCYLRAVINPADQEAYLRIINQPRRGIGEESLDAITRYNRQNKVSFRDVLWAVAKCDPALEDISLSSKARQGITEFVAIMDEAKERFASGSLAEALTWLLDKIDYQKAIRDEVKSGRMRDFKAENVQEFVSSLAEYENQADASGNRSDKSLSSFLSSFSLDPFAAAYAKEANGQEDRLQLMTFHASKGLEFPACFLVGMEDHIIPHEKSIAETGLEEERRLMYVAITRAKKFLTISMAKQRKRMGKDGMSRPSRFLFEIPKELLKMTDWRL